MVEYQKRAYFWYSTETFYSRQIFGKVLITDSTIGSHINWNSLSRFSEIFANKIKFLSPNLIYQTKCGRNNQLITIVLIFKKHPSKVWEQKNPRVKKELLLEK